MSAFSSLYRVQLSEHLSFSKVRALLPYFKKLGVEGLYFSPYFTATSSHGYDSTDPETISPLLGGEEEWKKLCDDLKKEGLAHIMDIVPNHMGIKGGKNRWWNDVLQYGPHSLYASFFDINWHAPYCFGKILLPFLHAPYEEILERLEIQLKKCGDAFFFSYGEELFPLAPESIPRESEIEKVNCSSARLHELLEKQHYRLAYRALAMREINYRRFFDIDTLVAIKIEKPHVLETHHRKIFSIMDKKVVQGVRIDHPDGLFDPAAYFKELKEHGSLPLFVEKILSKEERLPKGWHIEGSVGYEYLNLLTGLFVDHRNKDKMDALYRDFIGMELSFEKIVYECKKTYATEIMVSEIAALASTIHSLCRECSYGDLLEALQEIIACFPQYRTYMTPDGYMPPHDRAVIKNAIKEARDKAAWLDEALFISLETILLNEVKIILRFQQITGPIMAKGLEDRAFYRFHRLISLNEVGSEGTFGVTPEEFHKKLEEKQKNWPLGFFPTSTHDTKRSGDVRMRLTAISEIPEEWSDWLQQQSVPEGIALNDLYLFYQLLLGSVPIAKSRLWGALQKSLREGGERTSWRNVNVEYEKKVMHYIEQLLSDPLFLESLYPLQQKVDRLGALNSLSAEVVRWGAPAIVDLYQGNEELHYALVDPDNRREVDFSSLQQKLEKVLIMEAAVLYKENEFSLLKLWIIHKMLHVRKNDPSFFLEAEYLPLQVEGEKKEHVIAYARKKGDKMVLIMATRLYNRLGTALGSCWKGTNIELPPGKFTSIFTQKAITGKASLVDVFQELPFQVFTNLF